MQIELADIQKRHEIDDAPFHGEHATKFSRGEFDDREHRGTDLAAFQRGLGSQKSRLKTDDRTDPLNRSFGERHRAENPPGARAVLRSYHRHPRIVCCGERCRRQVDRLQRAAHPSPPPPSYDFPPSLSRGSLRPCRVRVSGEKARVHVCVVVRRLPIRGCAVNLFDIPLSHNWVSLSRCTSLTNLKMPPDASCATTNVNRRHSTRTSAGRG